LCTEAVAAGYGRRPAARPAAVGASGGRPGEAPRLTDGTLERHRVLRGGVGQGRSSEWVGVGWNLRRALMAPHSSDGWKSRSSFLLNRRNVSDEPTLEILSIGAMSPASSPIAWSGPRSHQRAHDGFVSVPARRAPSCSLGRRAAAPPFVRPQHLVWTPCRPGLHRPEPPSLAQSGSITSAGGPGVQSGRTGYFPQVSQSMLDQGRRTIVGPRPPQAMALPGLSAALPPVPLKPSREITASARFPRIAISIPRAPSSFRGLAA